MSGNQGRSDAKTSKTLIYLLVIMVVMLVVVAGLGWGLYFIKTPAQTNSQKENQVASLAYSHWQAIGEENLSATVAQYSSSSVLYWNVKGSSLNGTYTNLSQIESTWSKFYLHDPIDYFSIYNLKISMSGNYANVTADLWYIVLVNSTDKVNISGLTSIKGSGSVNSTVATLILPYQMTYENQNGAWHLQGDWWGLPSPDNGFVVKGLAEQFLNLSVSQSSSSGYGG